MLTKILKLEERQNQVNDIINDHIKKGWELVKVSPQFGFDSEGILVSPYYVVHLQRKNEN